MSRAISMARHSRRPPANWFVEGAVGRMLFAVLIAGVAGCAGAGSAAAGTGMSALVMCKHCNCTMPGSLAPGQMCPVCNCKFQVHDCIRGR